jgi:hypothetical protein
MAPDPDLYGPPEHGNENDEQDDDWEVLFEWAPPAEDDDDHAA